MGRLILKCLGGCGGEIPSPCATVLMTDTYKNKQQARCPFIQDGEGVFEIQFVGKTFRGYHGKHL